MNGLGAFLLGGLCVGVFALLGLYWVVKHFPTIRM